MLTTVLALILPRSGVRCWSTPQRRPLKVHHLRSSEATVGPLGALWGLDQLNNDLFCLDPNTGNIQTFTIPFTAAPISNATLPKALGKTALSCTIRPGADGNVSSALGTRNQLVQINPTTNKIDVFNPPNALTQAVGDLQPFNDLYSAKDGIYFTQTTANLISFFSFKAEQITDYVIPTLNSSPLDMFVDSQGLVWFTELAGQKVGRFNPGDKTFKEYPVPLPQLAGPAVVRVETEKRYIWFTAFVGNAMGRLDKVTGKITAYPNPLPGGFVGEDTLDGDGNVWQNALSRLNSTTGKIGQIVMPGTAEVAPVSTPLYFVIAMNYGPGNAIWFTEETANR